MDELDRLVREKMRDQGDKVGALKVEVTEETFQQMRGKILDEFEKTKIEVGKCYEDIINILKTYVDLNEKHYPIIALWIVGTYVHKEFITYPYLYLNAMKGSGKTRLLRLIASLSYNGEILLSMTEAVLFRTKGTLCIDEFERVGGKEKSSLRELLNACYKKGSKIKRMRKSIGKEGEKQVVEEFEPYRPIVMANIWGMEEVLEDRCIPLILEKSKNLAITKLIEDFDEDPLILSVKRTLEEISVVWCSVVRYKNIKKEWNNYIINKYNYTTTHTTYTTITTLNNTRLLKEIEQDQVFLKIDETNIDSRSLELFMPLFVIANTLDWVLFDNILEIAVEISKLRKTEEFSENKDVLLIDFVSQQEFTEYISMNELTKLFRKFTGDMDEEVKWINSKWLGRALRRLNLIIQKKRMAKGVEVVLDIIKAKDKIKMFK